MYNPVFAPEALARKEKIQAAMRCMSADALLLTDNANLYYTSSRVFCGYTYTHGGARLSLFRSSTGRFVGG